ERRCGDLARRKRRGLEPRQGRKRDSRRLIADPQLLLTPARVVQPGAEDGLEVEVGDDEVLLECEPARDALATLVHDQACAARPPRGFTWAAHPCAARGARGIHPLAKRAFAGWEGGAVVFPARPGPPWRWRGGRPRRIPDVFAPFPGERRLARHEDRRVGACL